MNAIVNFGSINIDYVYRVDDFVKPGETVSSLSREINLGGKGCNQSVAIAKAGGNIFHVGNINESDKWIEQAMKDSNVDTSHLKFLKELTGHAIIQVTSKGENSIIIHGGANHQMTEQTIDDVLSNFEKGDFILLQNEINNIAYAIEKASSKGMKVILNPAPMNREVFNYPLNLVDLLIINESEGQALAGKDSEEGILSELSSRFPDTEIVLTLGEQGSIYRKGNELFDCPALPVEVVDTTAAGDTFVGYLLSSLVVGIGIKESMKIATKAASISVSREGAAKSIPTKAELEAQ